MVIDAHQHFWDPVRADYPWMDAAELTPIRRAFGPTELAETEEFLRIARATPSVIGVVGWADLTDAALGATLDRLRGLPGGAKLVGIRHQVHDEADPDWLLRADVQRGLAAVFARDLTYDFLVRTRELPAAIATAKAFPQASFVLDHAAKPPIADGGSAEWSDRIASLAACGNVWCKVSGLATEAKWTDWDAERLFPFVQHVANCFGEDRLIFGSDWPVCLLAGSYGEIKSALEACLAKLGPQVRKKAFGANAKRAYRLALG
jgi:L-fuconolactonase